jgi:septum formation protein
MPVQTQKRSLILASSSPYRKMLLDRLGIPFAVQSPEVDESRQAGESPERMVERLAAWKASAVAQGSPAAVVIGSDQVALHEGRVVGKPGSTARARQQLSSFSGRQVDFLTAVSVQCLEARLSFAACVVTEVCFRDLSEAEIERYIARDNPVDCAGSFKSEAAGIALLRSMRSSDPTAIVGLPLISVAEALRQAGYAVP